MVSSSRPSPAATTRDVTPTPKWLTAPDVWLALLVLTIAVGMRVWTLGGGIHDYDEGVYWQSLRAMATGKPLFSAIFSSQPPLFLLLLYPFYLLFGQTLVAARLAIVLFSVVGLAAVYVLGRVIGGRWCGLAAFALLATDPLYLQESYTLQAEVPALALALATVACAALAARAAGARRRWLAALTGVLLALGCAVKLFDAVALVPVALYLCAPFGSVLPDRAGSVRWRTGEDLARTARQVLPDLLACAGGAVLGAVSVLLPFVGVWPALYDQAVRFHTVAGQLLDAGLDYNVGLIAGTQSELPLTALAVVAVLVALPRRHWLVLVPALWALASLVLLLRQQPLFPHHVVLLVPPLVVCVAVALPDLLEFAARVLAPRRSSDSPTPHPPLARPVVWGLLALIVVWGLAAGGSQLAPAATLPSAESRAAQAVAAVTRPGDLVVADDQFIVGLADRDVPPQLVDTSEVRIASGFLTLTQLERAVQDSQVTAVLFYSGRFDTVPGFRAWMARNYTVVGTFGGETALYIKAPPPLAPA